MSNWTPEAVARLSAPLSVHTAGTTTPRAAKEATGALKTARKPARQAEQALQIALVRWFALQYPEFAGHLFAVPNGGQRHKAVAAKMKQEGQLAGVADLVLAVTRPSAPALFLELKIAPNKPSDAQRLFLERMQAQGYATAVAYSFDAAREAVRAHIGY